MTNDDGQIIYPSKTQRWLIAHWLETWRQVDRLKTEYNASVHTHINGDWLDINRHSKYQLIDFNDDTVIQWGVQVIKPLRDVSDVIFVERGTEAHTGGVGHLEEQAARIIGAEKNPNTGRSSWWYFEGEAERFRYVVTHHPGTNSMRPWTQGGGANRAAAMMTAAYYGQSWMPQLAVFNHVHHNEDSYDNHPVRAIFNRAWQVNTAYSHRIGFGKYRSIIGSTLVVVSGASYRVHKFIYELPRGKPWKKN
jgi:hypothetical protein